jgi:hypothetical protein
MSKIIPTTLELLVITIGLVAGYLFRAWTDLGEVAAGCDSSNRVGRKKKRRHARALRAGS